jgi:ABC-type antimicrobial peptide transport system permease subunit
VKSGVGMSQALSKIEEVFRKAIPSAPFDYKFVDELYASKFAAEVRFGTLVAFFSILAIFISCLGLFGLSSFTAEQRTKEIGVRKVLGASVLNIWYMLSKDFALLVVISLLVAIPVAYYFMHNWLDNFPYRVTLSWWIFALAGLGAMIITVLTISVQSVKAAFMNPVRSLKADN